MHPFIYSALPALRRPKVMNRFYGTGLLLAGLFSGAAMSEKGWLPFDNSGKIAPIYIAADSRVADPVSINASFAPVAKAVTPAVVTVRTLSRSRPAQNLFFGDSFGPFGMDPFREFFFRRGLPEENNQRPLRRRPESLGRLEPSGLGSGVIVSPDGYILTNNHVVEGADKVEVTFNDHRNLTARVVGADPPSDVAVLKVDGSNFPTVPLGDSDRVEIGDVALAVGNPLGVGQTVTMGIISAKGRSTPGNSGSGSYEDFLQTDASINRGNSGGALVNLKGELIGVPSQILSQTGGNIGIGFAIPTSMARTVMDQLLKNGKVRRGKLGITIGDLTPEMAAQFEFKAAKGALVQDVEAGQAAERAGIVAGDIITEFQGQAVNDSSRLRNQVAQTAPGSTVKLKVWRNGAEREIHATLAEMESRDSGNGGNQSSSSPSSLALSGVRVTDITSDLARRLNLPVSSRGVVITEIDPDSGAADAGLQRGDLIEEVNRQPIANVKDYESALQRTGRNHTLVRVRRAEGARFVVVKPRE